MGGAKRSGAGTPCTGVCGCALASEPDETGRRSRACLASAPSLERWLLPLIHSLRRECGSSHALTANPSLLLLPSPSSLPPPTLAANFPISLLHLHRHHPQCRCPHRPRCPQQRLLLPTDRQVRHLAVSRAPGITALVAEATSRGQQPLCVWTLHPWPLPDRRLLPQCSRSQAFPRTLCIISS